MLLFMIFLLSNDKMRGARPGVRGARLCLRYDHIGVDNGAAGVATAAPIIWLVVVIQK